MILAPLPYFKKGYSFLPFSSRISERRSNVYVQSQVNYSPCSFHQSPISVIEPYLTKSVKRGKQSRNAGKAKSNYIAKYAQYKQPHLVLKGTTHEHRHKFPCYSSSSDSPLQMDQEWLKNDKRNRKW